MKILITGVAGYIGSNLAEFLISKGHTVIGIDNFNDYYNPKVKEYNIRDVVKHSNFSLYRVDLTDNFQLDSVFEKEKNIDGVAHFAAWAGVTTSWDKPGVYVRNNIEATVNLLEQCRKNDVNNFIFASTSSIYGNASVPFVETMSSDFPLAPYPATKKACEVMLYSYSKNYNINTTIFRIFNPNGPKMRPDLALPILIKSCLYGVEFKQFWTEEMSEKTGRDYCYLPYMLEAFETALLHPNKYEIFNLGNSSPVTLTELIKTVESVTAKRANIKHMPARNGEMLITYANISKAQRVLGYNPNTSIEKIVQTYYEWFIKQEEWYRMLSNLK